MTSPRRRQFDGVDRQSHAPIVQGWSSRGRGAQSHQGGEGMALKIRRVVTGHDDNGRAVITIDEICKNVMSRRPKHESCVVWSTGSFPGDNSGAEDGGARPVATTDPNGTVFRIRSEEH